MRIVLAAAALLITAQASAETLQGPARIVDGDTLDIAGENIRLHGIDAPETAQRCSRGDRPYRCGDEATDHLAKLIAGRDVTCEYDQRDGYDRPIAICSAGGAELNAAMVEAGWALAFRKYSTDYVDQEAAAKSAKAGMWSGDFIPPWDFRSGRWQAADQAAPDPACPINGNISRNGSRIYHAPWSKSYNRTKIDTSKGERWFCTEGEARAAGWRPPNR